MPIKSSIFFNTQQLTIKHINGYDYTPTFHLINKSFFYPVMASRITLPRHLANTLKHVRLFMTTPTLRAGHNKWSKTKHIKAVTDKKKMTERTTFVKNITLYSRMYGENIQFNPQLANAITLATRGTSYIYTLPHNPPFDYINQRAYQSPSSKVRLQEARAGLLQAYS